MPTPSGILNELAETPVADQTSRLLDQETGIAMLADLYVQRDPEAVARFLREHESLVGHLIDAHSVISDVFRPGFLDASLTWEPDPEEDYECLVVGVRARLSPEDCVERIRQFDHGWWLDMPFEVRNNVVVLVWPR